MMTLVNSTSNRHWTIYVHICCNCSHCPSVCPFFPTELCRNQARMIMEKYLHKCSIAGEATTLVTNGFPSTGRLQRLAANWTCSTPLWTAWCWMSRPFQMKTKNYHRYLWTQCSTRNEKLNTKEVQQLEAVAETFSEPILSFSYS